MQVTARTSTLMDAVFPQKGLVRDAALVLGFSILTAICAQASFWIGPVPITGQTFAVLLAGALLGSYRGAIAMLSYLAIGLTGIPYWYALGGAPGIARLVGPTGGYIVGFIAMAFVIGWLCERGWDKKFHMAALAMLIGSVIMYMFGLSWLAHFVPGDKVLSAGLYPFIPGDLIKMGLAAIALPSGWRLLRRLKK